MQADRLLPLIGNRYQLEEQLGRGGMGAVYRAVDRLTGEDVALKRVTAPTEQLQFASRLSDDSHLSGQANLRMALAQEFRALASLRHPNIIRVLDYGFDAERQPYLTMDLLRQPQNLRDAGRDQPLEIKIDLLVQMLQALAYLHRRGIVHRDLKPDNVAVVQEHGANRVRVLDFGLALTHDYLSDARGMAGTLAYMSPEVLQGDEATVASDLYAVGVMMYELLSGVHPFAATQLSDLISKVLKTEPDLAPLLDVLPPAPPSGEIVLVFAGAERRATLPEIVDRLLAKHPGDRYREAYDVIADLCAATGVPVPQESDAIRESFLQAARFVGRAAELTQLQAALAAARAGKGSLWLIGGESGVGKSRLLEELRTRALIDGVLALHGQAQASGGVPFELWCDPLSRLTLSSEVTAEEASLLRTILPDAGFEAAPYMGSDAQARLPRVIIDLFRRVGEPALLLLEDAQWANEGLDVLKQLAPFVEELPLLVVASFRDDERPTLPDELPQAQLLSLKRLAPDEIAELSASMLGSAGMQEGVIEFLQRETEGNAFFLVETVRALAEESGSLSSIGSETLPERLFTGGMQQVIWRRLKRVPEWALELLKLAAVVGREVDLDVLEWIVEAAPLQGGGVDLEEWLTLCANRAIFEAQAKQVSRGGWRFVHDKLREALLDALTPDEQADSARQAAEAVEAVYADDLDRYAAALAAHWRAAGDFAREGHYTLIAAQQAEDASAYPQARRLYERVLEIRAYEDADDPTAGLATLHHALGNTLYRMSEYDAAREQQRASLKLYEALGDRKGIAEAINALGESDMRQGLLDEAEAEFRQALAIRQALGLNREIGYSAMNLGVIQTSRNDWTGARDYFKQCLDYMETSGSPRDLARALNNYANALDVLGDKETARQTHLRALDIREREHDLHGVCYSLGNLGFLEFDLEHYDDAKPLFEKGLHIARQIVDQMACASYTAALGELSLKARDYETARRFLRESLDLRRKIEDRGGMITSMRELGDVARESEDFFSAQAYYREALTLSIEYGFPWQIWGTLQAIARLLMAQKRPRPALKLLAFVRAKRETPDHNDQDLINTLEAQMTENAVASAVALGEALTLDEIRAKVEQGELDL